MTIPTSEPLESRLRRQARALGFVACGIAPAEVAPEAVRRLKAWLAAGMHGGMAWMEGSRRGQPRDMWADARTAVVLGLPYTPSVDPFRNARRPDRGTISVYALGRDYHEVIKPRLKRLARWLLAEAGGGDARVFVDTAPLMEKPLAEAAGIGWQGKHSNLVSRCHGSWLFLATILTTLPLAPGGEPGAVGACGSCSRCIAACPTGAIVAPYVVDARRCISYLTVEHRGPVEEALRPMLGNRIHGCDDCLAVCPWNRFARAPADPALALREGSVAPALAELLALDEAGFRARFAGTPVRRTGRDRFARNCLYAAGNSGEPDLLPAVERLADDPDPAVADAARWAAQRLRTRARPAAA
ncbi:tRNA epoxyqueuosine(34) reductase QueG [Thermaurantiacus tibetensis]|uniref:tRNA epoxyqueuosine(34) reductase QueG n=1 Tax=Thermaurantiacus tibetensis TaxID=2759035 RepID=UPI00188F11B8|nr:tRNA epoxyqueuosine(34) reductase QueG [Thermaurantiacus tibetensis]